MSVCIRCGLVALLLAACGCALLGDDRCLRDPPDIERARRCFVQGDYRCADQAIQRFLITGAGQPEYDRALHLAAMNCLCAGTAGGGHECALDYLQRLVRECPASSLLPEAALWISLLGDLAQHRQEAAQVRRALGEAAQARRALEHTCESSRAERDAGRAAIKRLEREVDELQQKIKALETVDVQFFQRKKDLGDVAE